MQYARDLKSILRIVRFDWGVATIDALVSADGKALVVAGQCQRDFATFAQTVTGTKRIPLEIPPTGATKKSSAAAPAGDVFLVRFNAATLKPEWLWVLEKAGTPPDRLFADPAGNILFDVAGLRAVTANGKELKLIHPRHGDGKARWLGVDPVDGAAYFGGDRNTQCGVTRRWPYRQPFLDKFKGEEKIWTLWEPVPTEVGPDTGKMESDSSPRTLGWAANGDLIIGG